MMEQCRKLEEYAVFIDTIRKFQEEGMGIEQAVDDAIATCIENGCWRIFYPHTERR